MSEPQDIIEDAESLSESPVSFEVENDWEKRIITIDGDEFEVLYNPVEGDLKLHY